MSKFWRNKHGISYEGAQKFSQKLNQDFNESRGYKKFQPTSWHKIPKDAEKSSWMLNYWDNYFTDIMSIKEHTRYNSVQWIQEGKVTEFKPMSR